MNRITLITWLWKQPSSRTSYTAVHVNILAAMIRRNCTLDFDFACVTDVPEGIDPSVRIITPPGFHDGLQTSRWKGGRPSCYRRLAIFRPDAADVFGGERIASIDLDTVIGDNIDAILSRPEDVVINGPSQSGPRWIFNGSLVMLTAGARPRVYTEFTPQKAEEASRRFVGSDQAWLAYILGKGEATFNPPEVCRWGQAAEAPILFFPGEVKPWDMLAHPWIARHYRMDAGRSGLILGGKGSVWDEAKAALKKGPVDRVIALPGAASRWPGVVDAVARDIPHGMALARMLGVDEPVVCGG